MGVTHDNSYSKQSYSIANMVGLAIAFIAGIAIPSSTSLLNISLVLVTVAALFTPKFISNLSISYKQPFIVACSILYVLLLLGCAWSHAPTIDILHVLKKMSWLILLPALAVFFMNDRYRKAAFLGFVCTNILALVLSYIAFITHHPILHGESYPDNLWVPFRGHAYHCYYLGLTVIAFLYMLTRREVPGLWLKICMIVFILLAVFNIYYVIYSRTGQINFVIMLILFLLLWQLRLGAFFTTVICLIGVPLIFMTSHNVRQHIHEIQTNMSDYHQGKVQTSIGYRMAFHHYSMQLIRQSPIIGHGTGSYNTQFAKLANKDKVTWTSNNPHSDYLLFGVQLGVFGVFGFIAVLATLLIQAYRNLSEPYRTFGVIIAISYAITCIENSFFTDSVGGVSFALMTAFVVATYKNKYEAYNR